MIDIVKITTKNPKFIKKGRPTNYSPTNYTNKSLWALFKRRGIARDPLLSLLSTEKGHHNRVPRKSLVQALDHETRLDSTEGWRNQLVKTYDLQLDRQRCLSLSRPLVIPYQDGIDNFLG